MPLIDARSRSRRGICPRFASLKVKLTLGAVLLGVVLLFVQSMLHYSVLRGSLLERIEIDQFALVSEVAAGLDEKIEERLKALSEAALGARLPIDGPLPPLEAFLANEKALLTMFDDLYIFDPRGVLRVDWPEKAGRRGLDMSSRDYIRGVRQQRMAVVSQPVIGRSTRQPIVVLAAPILDASGELAGILAGVLNLHQPNLLGTLSQRRIGENGYFYMVAPDRTVIAHPDRARILRPIAEPGVDALLDRALKGFEGTGEGSDGGGGHGLHTYKRLRTNGWLLASVIPEAEAFYSLAEMERRMLLVTLLLALFCAPALWLYFRSLVRPLGALAQSVGELAQNVQPGVLPAPVREEGSREIRTVARAFNRFLAAWSQAESRQRLAARVFETTAEAIVVCDARAVILAVNPAFSRITGYGEADVVGRSMRILRSDQHSPVFYKSMWRKVVAQGRWSGETWNQRKNGDAFPMWQTISSVRNDAGEVTHYVFVFADHTEIHRARDVAEHLAWNDPLTGLANRAQVLRELQRTVRRAEGGGRRFAALLLIDLDRFKLVNEAHGLAVGDTLLKIVAARLSRTLDRDDIPARIAADQFALLLAGRDEATADAASAAALVQSLADTLRERLREGIEVADEVFHFEASAGIALLPENAAFDAEEILRQAETAVHQAKHAGGARTVFFDAGMTASIRDRYRLERELRLACSDGGLRLYLQPQVDARGALVGAEALVRWQHPRAGLIAPGEFIPQAEESDLIVAVDRWMLFQVCRLLAWQQRAGFPLRISANVSPRHFQRADFLDHVLRTLDETGADPALLVLEITEGLVIGQIEEAIARMSALTQRGIRFSMDDFGTGYSSLAYLKRLPIQELKIDRSFIQDAPTRPSDAALVQTVVAVARNLGLEIVAEGVETRAQADFLRGFDPLVRQGHLYGRPEPEAAWCERLRAECRERSDIAL